MTYCFIFYFVLFPFFPVHHGGITGLLTGLVCHLKLGSLAATEFTGTSHVTLLIHHLQPVTVLLSDVLGQQLLKSAVIELIPDITLNVGPDIFRILFRLKVLYVIAHAAFYLSKLSEIVGCDQTQPE